MLCTDGVTVSEVELRLDAPATLHEGRVSRREGQQMLNPPTKSQPSNGALHAFTAAIAGFNLLQNATAV